MGVKRIKILCLLAICTLYSIPVNGEIVLEEDFEGQTTVIDPYISGSASSITSSESYSGTKSLEMHNSGSGKFSARHDLGASYDELYAKYMFKVGNHQSSCWNSNQHYKNMGFEGGTTECKGGSHTSDGTDCFTVRTRFNYPKLGVHVESAPFPGKFDSVNDIDAADGEWHCLEMKVTMNTPGTDDGEIRHWVDGDETVVSDLEFRTVDTLKIDKWWFTYWSNDAWCGSLYLDDLVINTERTGCSEQCDDDSDCNDDNACNGIETCSSGSCQTGILIDTDDGIDCTVDSCDPVTGLVTNTPDNALCQAQCRINELCTLTGCTFDNEIDGTDCDDGISTTQRDVCDDGICSGTTCSLADVNSSGDVSIDELIDFVDGWKLGTFSIVELMLGINEWKDGC